MLNKIFFEISYRIYLKFNLSDTHFSWKGYLIGRLPPKINIHLIAYKKKTGSLKMSTVKNPTFTFDLTQIQVVSFQCHQFFYLKGKDITYGLKIILKYVGFCRHSVFCSIQQGLFFIQQCRNPFCFYVLLSNTSFSTGTHVQWYYTLINIIYLLICHFYNLCCNLCI